ncbi:MAG: hypothetical protein ACK58N_13380, partial [Synechocystis sp.]
MPQTTLNNPLLQGRSLPLFDRIQASDVVPAVETLITELEQTLANLEKTVDPTWAGLVETLTELEERLT